MRFSSALAVASLLGLGACVSVELDGDELQLPPIDGPTVEFDPSGSVIPFPNNLLIDQMTGLVNIPEQCGEGPEQTALREGVLNASDGFGTFKLAMRLTVTEAVGMTTLADNITVYRIASAGVPTNPAEEAAVPFVAFPSTTTRFDAACANATDVDSIIVVPLVPLTQNSTYAVAITRGLKTAGGADYLPSATWAFVRQAVNPVTVAEDGSLVAERTPFSPADEVGLATILGINLLWNAHAGALAFFDAATSHPREDILLAWTFNTQTTTTPLDPASAGSLAADLPGDLPLGMASIAGGNGQAFLIGALGATTCNAIGCAAVDDVVAGALVTPNYQVDTPNPLTGGDIIPGPWPDPRTPAKNGDSSVQIFATVPAGAEPANGWPTVIFAHGITRSKEDMFGIAPQLAAAGIATVAIDFVVHGSRAVQDSDEATLGCTGTPTFADQVQCFAPFFSPNLAATRDNFRQTALNLMDLAEAISACTGANCGGLNVDPNKIGFLGHSLGGIIGSMVTAQSSRIQASVLNVAGAGLVDFIENTDNLFFACGLIDALIDSGVIVGDKSDLTAVPPTGICTTDAWKAQASYQSFAAAGRWVLDPGEPATYAASWAAKTYLLQMVTDDAVVPNIMSNQLGALTGLTVAPARAGDGTTTPPGSISPSIFVDPNQSKFIEYGAANEFDHGSILAPSANTQQAQLGTIQMQIDAITFLGLNL